MSDDAYYKDIRAKLKKAVGGGVDTDEVVWTVIEACSAIVDGATGTSVAGTGSGVAQGIYSAITGRSDPPPAPNPWFIWNGQDEVENKYTKKYLRNRGRKGMAGAVIGTVGVAASQATQVDVGGMAMHGNAVGSTAAHIIAFRAIASRNKKTKTIANWLDVVLKMKYIKAGVRGGQFAGSAIPVGAVGIATGVAAAAVKLGAKLTLTKACMLTASDLHWRAFQEQAISSGLGLGTGKVGPASNIIYELFKRHGVTRIFGKYNVDQIIKEPIGWNAIADKLLLI